MPPEIRDKSCIKKNIDVNLCFRYAQFYSQDEFCHYNMFNHHFFDEEVCVKILFLVQCCQVFIVLLWMIELCLSSGLQRSPERLRQGAGRGEGGNGG